MAETIPQVSNAGDVPTNTQSIHNKEQQDIVLNRNIERLISNLERSISPISQPQARFTTGEIVAIAMLALTIAGLSIGAFNFSGRLDKIDAAIMRSEDKSGNWLEKLDDRFLKLDEAVSRSLSIPPAPRRQ